MRHTKLRVGVLTVLVAIAAVMLGYDGKGSQPSSAAQTNAETPSGVAPDDPRVGKTVHQLEDERRGRCFAEKLFEPKGIIGPPEVIYFVNCRTNKLPLSFGLSAASFERGKYAGPVPIEGATAVKSGRGYDVNLACDFWGGEINDCGIPQRAVERTPRASYRWKVSFTGILQFDVDPCEARIFAGMSVPGPYSSLAGFQSALPPVKGCQR